MHTGGHLRYSIDFFTVFANRAAEILTLCSNPQHQAGCGIPPIHQDSLKRQVLMAKQVLKHVSKMVNFAFAIAIFVVDTVVNQPELVGVWCTSTKLTNPMPLITRFWLLLYK